MKEHAKALTSLSKAMESDDDMREMCRDSDDFINKKDGQWESEVQSKMSGRPRYTFDKVNPAIDQVVGEIRQNDFTLRVSPAGDGADKKTAQTLDGLIRNIVNLSAGELIFDDAAEQMIGIGCAGFEVVNDYVDSDCFDQDLIIKPLHDFHNRVFFDSGSKLSDRSDANFVHVLEEVEKEEYKRLWPDGSELSVSKDCNSESYQHKPESVTVGRLLFKKKTKKTIIKMSDGTVTELTPDVESVLDDLAQAGIAVVDKRERNVDVVYQRYYDGKDWLDKEEETVFRHLPIIPMYANFRLSQGKVIYRSLTQFAMDAQRGYNYSRSKQIEEVALSPKAKYWMTNEQVKGHQDKLRTLNTNSDPVQTYNPDPLAPNPPPLAGGAVINQGLSLVTAESKSDINESLGLFGASMGDNPNLQSGIAINQQIDRGNNGTIKYFSAIEHALNYLGKVLIDAIPRVYDATRMVRIIGEDGSSDISEINKTVLDSQTGELVTINDLSVGKYDVTCDIGTAFKNRQDEAADMFSKMVTAVPEIAQLGLDVYLSNINAPGFDKVAERARLVSLNNGVIPQEQMTDEELQQAQQAQQQPQEPSAEMVLAQAEMQKAQADMLAQQTKQQELQLRAADVQAKYQGQAEKLQSETALNMAKVNQGQQKLDQDSLMQQQQQQMEMMRLMIEQQKAQSEEVAKLASALKSLKDATGADAIVSGSAATAYESTAQKINSELSGPD